jgi:hypothetical protein
MNSPGLWPSSPKLAPFAFTTKMMDPRISVAVGDVDLSVRRDGGACWMVEGGHPSRNVPFADPQQHFTLKVEGDNLMRVAIGDPDAVPAVNRNVVRIEDLAPAAATHERAVRVDDEHGRLPRRSTCTFPSESTVTWLTRAGATSHGGRPKSRPTV